MNFTNTRIVLVAGVALLAAACSSTEPNPEPFSLCVHAQGVAFFPGSSGAACAAPPTVRQNQSVTMVLEADNHVGVPRTADLTIISGPPTGWTATLGAATIAVPGQQTLTIAVPAGTSAGFYPIRIRARVGALEEAELTFDIRVTPSGTL